MPRGTPQCFLYRLVETNQYSSRINLLTATEDQLAALSDACDAATFGLNQQDVLDESYRKARKMDVENFATPFEVSAQGCNVLEIVRRGLLEAAAGEDGRRICAELYKLNIYGQ